MYTKYTIGPSKNCAGLGLNPVMSPRCYLHQREGPVRAGFIEGEDKRRVQGLSLSQYDGKDL